MHGDPDGLSWELAVSCCEGQGWGWAGLVTTLAPEDGHPDNSEQIPEKHGWLVQTCPSEGVSGAPQQGEEETRQGHVLSWVVSIERKGYFSEKSPFLGHTKAVHDSQGDLL